ncbi:macrophage mannose receptor 1-like isoform X2 [Melanotaenia boesemani]|uniref:macrophage mannose receptor 1-like isoform X2 n=1 Tax=Melanotaenia boesemani TaxID=1250792 RepID=UPI001C04F7DC|nr:macrophage mannose receptor 1-like isoform X2 [Melanotaenia boesemani]
MMLWRLLFIVVIGATVGILSEKHYCQEPQGREPVTAKCNAGNVILTKKTSSQSSTFTGNGITYSSDRAVDGNYDKCSITDNKQSWWKIDLRGIYNISCISIFNINATHADITNALIYIGNSRRNNGTNNTLDKVAVLCEVNINGTIKESPFILIKKKMIWEDALYYCRDNYKDLASILDEEAQAFAELEAEKADTEYVWLGLHYTCTLQFWFWVDNHAVEFERWNISSKQENCDMSGVMMKNEEHFWHTKSDYEMYNFICAKK